MSNEYENNHYVPAWYQKRFVLPGEKNQELYYLDLRSGFFVDPNGIVRSNRSMRPQGYKQCFAAKHLYTTTFGAEQSKKIETDFFGKIDNEGCQAVEAFTNFEHRYAGHEAFRKLMMYMSTQKLRTIKGLEWLTFQFRTRQKLDVLSLMVELRDLYCAIWTECVWLIADASQSETKFIVSDHPVTVYNRKCSPSSLFCVGPNDPDIRFHATHTIFPLSLEKILILTNLSWVRNPYQKEVAARPNPNPFRGALFKPMDTQVLRKLTTQEVYEINFIIKNRAWRFIGAGKKEWLYPEKFVSKSDWRSFGQGYLLMPDPRDIHYGGEVIMGFEDGSATAFDSYGRRPWQRDFGKEDQEDIKTGALFRFQGEFARLFGPYRRGRCNSMGRLSPERDGDEFHQYHLGLEKKKQI